MNRRLATLRIYALAVTVLFPTNPAAAESNRFIKTYRPAEIDELGGMGYEWY